MGVWIIAGICLNTNLEQLIAEDGASLWNASKLAIPDDTQGVEKVLMTVPGLRHRIEPGSIGMVNLKQPILEIVPVPFRHKL